MTTISSWSAIVAILFQVAVVSVWAQEEREPEYLILGVSGGLQDGFPEHERLDYSSPSSTLGKKQNNKALFVGKGLVRGYKAYLDVMEPGWRQYTPEESGKQPLINSNVFCSGCWEHANEYWIYLVDTRQVLTVLMHEPRFLSITPDTGLVEMMARETAPLVRDLFVDLLLQQGGQQNDKSVDTTKVAIPLVTAVWFQYQSHVPSPPIRIHEDGTEVTNFPESLALWAGVDDSDRTAGLLADDKTCENHDNGNACQAKKDNDQSRRRQRYWDGIRSAIRKAESNRLTDTRNSNQERDGPPYDCKKAVSFGVQNNTRRINTPLSTQEVDQMLENLGYAVDYKEGNIVSIKDGTIISPF